MQFCSLEFSLLEELVHARSSGFIWQYIQCCQGQSMIFLRSSQFSNKLGRNVEWEFSHSGPSGCFGIILMPAVLPGCCFFSPTSQNYSKLSLDSVFTCSFLPQEQGFLMLGTCWGHAVLIFLWKMLLSCLTCRAPSPPIHPTTQLRSHILTYCYGF